jgi:hypothetical protein
MLSLWTLVITVLFSGAEGCPALCKCNDGGLNVDCSHLNLTEIPAIIDANITRLDLSHNALDSIGG